MTTNKDPLCPAAGEEQQIALAQQSLNRINIVNRKEPGWGREPSIQTVWTIPPVLCPFSCLGNKSSFEEGPCLRLCLKNI